MPAAAMDFVVLTASSESQAARYAELVEARLAAGVYPRTIEWRFFSDPENGRVGSGGGTLLALSELLLQEATGARRVGKAEAAEFFSKKRTLVVHAGGESRRLPCYVPEGKLFAPLSLSHGSDQPPTVLDVLLTLYTSYPWKDGETIVCSGDVIVHFDSSRALPTGFARGDLCGFGVQTSLEQGSRHGVFGCSTCVPTDGVTIPVSDFFQKAPMSVLREHAAFRQTSSSEERCAVDTGIFSMSSQQVCALLGWATNGWADALCGDISQVGPWRRRQSWMLNITAGCVAGGVIGAAVMNSARGGCSSSRGVVAASVLGVALGGAMAWGARNPHAISSASEPSWTPLPIMSLLRRARLYLDFYLEIASSPLPHLSLIHI